ncbi:MAG: amidase, partial [Proteobacteria bacterium]|nr:amidase [Pseudomonadota bacterium]
MMSLEVLHFPLDDIASMVRNREISPVTLMKFVIDRVKTIHAQLNVIVEDRFEEALAEAKILENKIASGASLPNPLLGLPFSVKANISIKGMRLDMGSWSMHGQRATETATAITRLQTAGAIPICTTNISELGLWHDTVNPIYGRTLNPWHRSRIVGGSSGGETALVAAGGTLFGIASDFDGSLRIPSSFCGTFAHKPSRGIVPLTGQFPFFKPEEEIPWRALDSLGPVTRSAKDLALILDILAGPCSLDPMSMTGTLSTKSSDVYKKKIGIIENPSLPGTFRTSPEIKLGIHKCRQRLIEAGAEVVDAPKDLFFEGFMLWRLLVHRAFEGKLTK